MKITMLCLLALSLPFLSFADQASVRVVNQTGQRYVNVKICLAHPCHCHWDKPCTKVQTIEDSAEFIVSSSDPHFAQAFDAQGQLIPGALALEASLALHAASYMACAFSGPHHFPKESALGLQVAITAISRFGFTRPECEL